MQHSVVKRNGEIVECPDIQLLLSTLANGEYVLKIARKVKSRTLPQNSLMWMWFQCLEEATGQPKEDIHEYYRHKFLLREVTVGETTAMVPMSTTKLNTVQMSNYMDKIQVDAATELGVTLPLPEDMMYNDFVEYYRNR